jgi:hypothetical protein
MTMQKSSYAIRQFSENISQTTNISALKRLFQDPKLDLTIHFESNLPWSLAWDLSSNSLTGSCKITISPKLVINGELYEAPCKQDFVLPSSCDGLEAAFLKALKDSLSSVARVWD